MARLTILLLAGALSLGLAASGCGPSYKQKDIVSAIEDIAKHEQHLDLSARLLGRTLAVHLNHEGILRMENNQVELAPTANEVLGNAIETIHRVVLSSDTDLEFYLVLAADPKVPGVAFTLVRYIDDVKRANANMLTPTEFYSRTIFELHYVGPAVLSLDQVTSDIHLEQFLAWQLAKRIQVRLAETLRSRDMAVADMIRVAGKFENGEFAFTLSLDQQPDAQSDGEILQVVFQEAASVIAQVLAGYHFKQFESIRLVHPPTGRSLLLPKTRLEMLN